MTPPRPQRAAMAESPGAAGEEAWLLAPWRTAQAPWAPLGPELWPPCPPPLAPTRSPEGPSQKMGPEPLPSPLLWRQLPQAPAKIRRDYWKRRLRASVSQALSEALQPPLG